MLLEPGIELPVDDAMVETANPNEPQGIQDIYFAGQKIPVENFNGEYVYQGDIMIPQSMASTQEVKLVYEKGESPPTKVPEELRQDGLITRYTILLIQVCQIKTVCIMRFHTGKQILMCSL